MKKQESFSVARGKKIYDKNLFKNLVKLFLKSSVADPWHVGVDPDPGIHASD
jgi:hypothetical protein